MDEIMTQKIDDVISKRKDKRRQMVLKDDPFAPKIMAVPLLKGFKQPMIEAYDGVTDPLDHLQTFVDLMRLYAAPDAVMCRSFSPTLRREARDWVTTLAPRSKTFDELSRSFVAYFLSSKRKRKMAIGLMQLSDPCNRGSSNVNSGDWVDERNLKSGLQDVTSKNPSKSMHDLLKKRDKYFDAEEVEKVTKHLREGWEMESYKRKVGDELRSGKKNKLSSEQTGRETTQDRQIRQKR
ncbi:uncharacterized protein LOC111394142 [Olea europaea var. sylvestris]|uniref:uncharacterized protein LOC111394142 n=1 Tax=Olea europaea var. sylvestris TaxID=158386 RepID=UPI000C1D5771|nr:uncharacterized protein LOC111394142 [Olea europaea var. sylvestris]